MAVNQQVGFLSAEYHSLRNVPPSDLHSPVHFSISCATTISQPLQKIWACQTRRCCYTGSFTMQYRPSDRGRFSAWL